MKRICMGSLLLSLLPFFSFAQEEQKAEERLTEYLSTLVSMPTVTSNQKENEKALEWVEEELKSLPLHFNNFNFNGYPAKVITTQPTKTPKVLLVAHIDVVPAPEKLFHPIIAKGKMWARGAYDMKMAIACYILLLQELKGSLDDLDIGIMLTSDEEIGGMNGVKKLLEQGYGASVALLPDGGFDWKFEEAAKGIVQIKITAEGKSAHGSRPWEGENAITKLIGVLNDIAADFRKQQPTYGDYYPTMNIGMIQGGTSVNQVASHAEAKLDIRFPPPLTADQILSNIEKIAKLYPNVSVEKLIEGLPRQADLQQFPFVEFKQIAKRLYNISIGSIKSHGASDARFFGEKHIPVLVIDPKGGDIHTDKEWVDLNDLTRFYEVVKGWVLELGVNK